MTGKHLQAIFKNGFFAGVPRAPAKKREHGNFISYSFSTSCIVGQERKSSGLELPVLHGEKFIGLGDMKKIS